MTVELARRLIDSGVPLADVEAALATVVEKGLSFVEALVGRAPELLTRVELELSRSELTSVLTVRALPEAFARLPAGMCRRFLAVPVHVDPRTGRVDVAAVDPLDAHLAQELAFHLQQPVRLLQAPYEALNAALRQLQGEAKPSSLPPARAESVMPPQVPVRADDVVASPSASARPASRGPRSRSVRPQPEAGRISWRSKPPPADLLESAEGERGSAATAASRAPSAPPPPPLPSLRERLERAATPEAVLELLRSGLAPAVCVVFSVKSTSFDGRVASPEVEARAQVKQLSLLAHQPSVLETAVKSGFYLGPVPNTPNHRELRDALPPDAVHEVYVTVITVSGRPSLVWLLAGFAESLELTRRADEAATWAGKALARILRQRKRGE